MNRLEGKIALITGGARGLGEATARLFVKEGATVIITDILDGLGEALASEIGAEFIHQDVTSEHTWDTVVEQVYSNHGRIDVLINNAAVLHGARLVNYTTEDWNRVIAINQTATFFGMRAVARKMTAQGSGSIVNIASIAVRESPYGAIAYTASKAAVVAMTKVAARELGPKGIRVNVVLPGAMETEMVSIMSPEQKAQSLKGIALGRISNIDEVAAMVLFLAGHEGSYCTGQQFQIDGGAMI